MLAHQQELLGRMWDFGFAAPAECRMGRRQLYGRPRSASY